MNKKALSVLIAVVMLVSVVPAAVQWAPVTAATPSVPSSRLQGKNSLVLDEIPGFRRTGMIWVSPQDYARVTGIHFKPLTPEAFKEALENAPFYPGKTTPLAKGGSPAMTTQSLPESVFNDLYLPPIGDQGYVGSCNAWSSTYYVWTYMINWWRGNPYPSSPDVIMNPTFTYNLINGGEDGGSLTWDAMTVISTIGAVPLSAFPLYNYPPFPEDYLWVWPNLTQWLMAPHNSGTEEMYWWQYFDPYNEYAPDGQWYILYLDNETQWEYLKGLLAQGYVVQYAYTVTLPFYAVTLFESADDILEHLDYYAEYVANATNNQTYYEWVNQTYLSNETFIQGLRDTFMRYTVTVAFYNFTKETGWWKVWSKYIETKYGEPLEFYMGGHAVTIVGYDDTVETPDGYGVIKIANSWGSDWGDNGYFYVSYDDIRFGEESWGMAWVYVPKAANYTPELMAVVGVEHPVRGEVIDGTYDPGTYKIVKEAGIPVGVAVDGTPVYEFPYLNFWMDYVSTGDIPYFASDLSLLMEYLPQAHPFPDSPMAFDISSFGEALAYYMETTNETPLKATFFVNASDIVPDGITGNVTTFELLYRLGNNFVTLVANTSVVPIPDGGWALVTAEVPVVQYWDKTTANGSSVNYGSFDVDVLSIVPLDGAKVVIDEKSYPLSAEEGGYYYYATAVDQKLALPAGTYNYTVVVTYPNGKEVALEQ
ncbi:MAG: C1 family peptidase, partial [Thermococcus sp.]|nr:C1 family peptidase [Thermococcus sp.]